MDYGINNYLNLSQNDLYNLYRLQYANQNFGNYAIQNNYPTVQTPSFRGSLETQPDTFSASTQLQTKKEGMSTGAKWGLGILAGIGTLLTATTLIARKKVSQIEKLYKEKLILSDLGEHIDFSPAKKLEDAIKFTKEKLGIKDVDKDITLDALNYVNENLVKVSNKNKGKLFMPTKIKYTNEIINGKKEATYFAYANKDIYSSKFGELGINKNYFDNDYLTKKLKETFSNQIKDGKNILTGEKNSSKEKSAYKFLLEKEYFDLIDKFKLSPDSLTINEKRKLLYTEIKGVNNAYNKIISNPKEMIKNIKKVGLNINEEEIMKLPLKEQTKKIEQFLINNNAFYEIPVSMQDGSKTIFHEMGHLQDYAKNLKNMHVSEWKGLDFLHVLKNKNNKRTNVDEINNHWGGLTYKGYKEMLEKSPEKFKELYPDLYEHVTKEENQRIAGEISSYAQTSIGEFIAEVYAKMIAGEKISNDVMALYKKYGGPALS